VRVGITGTPGTGKSTVSQRLDGDVLDISRFLKENGIGESVEGEISVSREKLREKIPEPEGRQILDGHLSHLLDLDRCIVLRTRPDTLRERLEKRDYGREKIEENIEAEAMDLVLSEAVELQEKVYEVDTTDKDPSEVKKQVSGFIQTGEERYGNVDWTEWI
jgi:adenylate kinase